MATFRSYPLPRLLLVLAMVIVAKVTLAVVIGYRDYLPPNFDVGFLQGREGYFWGPYRWAFYVHLVSGPPSLVLGMLLVSERFRRNWPLWHRRLGRIQGMNVLLLVAPSGLWMAFYAATGAVAGAGLGWLAIATAVCVALGWKAAVERRFLDHRRWMTRTFVLLSSAVVIRLVGGLTTVLEYGAVWPYPAAAWLSWLVPLAVCLWLQRPAPSSQPIKAVA
jgi:hypothetical protein